MRDIAVVHLESTDVCQASCPQCSRETDIMFDRKQQHHLSVSQLQTLFSLDQLRALDKMFMCGNYGDPAAGRHTLSIYQWFRKHNSTITLGMNTNGALRSPFWWRELAGILNGDLDYVVFSIDGLEDTNHIYRRGVKWNKLMRNCQSFIEAGGKAHWDMLVFEHNEHQVDAARDLAKLLGFKWFRAKVSKRPPVSGIRSPMHYVKPREKIDHIQCHALSESSLYIDARGRIWPCCWLGDQTTLDQIDFQDIQHSWNTAQPHPTCATNCGTARGRTRFQQQWQIETELGK